MSDHNDIIQRRVEPILDGPSQVVDTGGARTPKQDLWDIDEDIFKPLLDRIQAESQTPEFHAAEKHAEAQSNPYTGSDHLGLVSRGNENAAARRRNVVSHQPAPPPVTIRSHNPAQMPRVVWGNTQNMGKNLVRFFENLNRRAQLTLAAVALFTIWHVIAIMSARLISLSWFDFDPLYPRNWEMLLRLYEQGSTLQWPFVLYYGLVFTLVPVLGVMIAVRAAPEFRKTMQKILSPLLFLPKLLMRLLGYGRKSAMAAVAEKPQYAKQPAYKGASFKKSATEGDDDTTGGSIGGGSGGGHGKPSWQGGPANTQAFPRAEQGRR